MDLRLDRLVCLLAVVAAVATPGSPARADDYGKNLLLVNKALRDGNCRQALDASRRMVELEPERPDAHLVMGDALFCIGAPFQAYLSFQRYLALGGTEEVGDRLAEIIADLPALEITVDAEELPPLRDYTYASSYQPSELSRLPSDMRCFIDGLDHGLLGGLIAILDTGCTMRLPDGAASVVRVSADGFTDAVIHVPDARLGQTMEVSTALIRGDLSDVSGRGVWLSSSMARYAIDLHVADGTHYEVFGDPLFVPLGLHQVTILAADGLEVLTEPLILVGEGATALDLTGPRENELGRRHGEVYLPLEDAPYLATLERIGEDTQGGPVSLLNGEKLHLLSGPYLLRVFREFPGEDGREPELLVERESDYALDALHALNLFDQGVGEEARQAWYAQLSLVDLPSTVQISLNGHVISRYRMEEIDSQHVPTQPGRYRLEVLSPWREPQEADIDLHAREHLTVEYEASWLPRAKRSRAMRRAGTATAIAGGASLIGSAVLAILATNQRMAAASADDIYMGLDAGDHEDDYTTYDDLRRQHTASASTFGSAAGVLLGVGAAAGATGFTLHIVAPRDPHRAVFRGL